MNCNDEGCEGCGPAIQQKSWLPFVLFVFALLVMVFFCGCKKPQNEWQLGAQDYVRSHNCATVWHTPSISYFDSPAGKVVEGGGYSSWDCEGVSVLVDDVDGKEWRP